MAAIALVIGLADAAEAGAQTPATTPRQPTSSAASQRSALPSGRVDYRTVQETYDEMKRLADSFPDHVIRSELPHRSLLGQPMWALEISHDVKASAGKPVFLMVGLHHAREWPTLELTMEFVRDLLKNDGVDTLITSLLNRARLIVVPIVNPDGYEMSRSMTNEYKRSNCRIAAGKTPTKEECADEANSDAGVDLNRNYAAFWKAEPGSGETPFSEPETQSIRDLMWSNQVTVALDNHTYTGSLSRVPTTAEEPVPVDVALYDSLTQAMGKALQWPAGAWRDMAINYPAYGILSQTAYYGAGTFSFGLENMYDEFHPPYAQVIEQYFGTGTYQGSSSRAGFLTLFAAAANPALHSVLKVKAPAGATLKISKSFTLETATPAPGGSPLTVPVTLTSSLTVPRGASEVAWHVNPSSRPSQHAQQLIQEEWTLTCTQNNGPAQTVQVAVARGAVATVDVSRCR